MSMNAGELVDLIIEKTARAEQKSFEGLKQKITEATGKMISNMTFGCDVDLTDEDLISLTKVTEKLRDLGYKFRFIEVQDTRGEIIKHRLHISVEHLKNLEG